MKYGLAVLLLSGLCVAQTNPTTKGAASADTWGATQAATDVSFQSAQLSAPQWVSALSFPLPTNDSTWSARGQDAGGQAPNGQTTTTTTTGPSKTTTKAKVTTNEPAWDWATGLAIGVAYSYTTGSPGLGSFNVGAGWRWKGQFELATDMDFGTQNVDISPVFSKSKRQNYLFGGRYYIVKALGKHSKFEPFGSLMYGVSHQSIKTQVGTPVTNEIDTAQTSWAWDFGGGVDYLLSKHWALRGRADWLKTHFNSQGQNHFKWVAGFWYSFTARKFLQ